MYRCLRSLLFWFDPETSHRIALTLLKWFYCSWLSKKKIEHFPKRPVNLFGLEFPNPVGLAAGLDKDGRYIDPLFGLGFGFIEVGTVTPKPQSGNPKPRLFRIPQKDALINRLGFNNLGVDQLVLRLKKRKIPGIVGANIGKNASTPLDHAYEDYLICYEKLYPYVDYVTINISSPNTPQLRDLHGKDYLENLLSQLKVKQQQLHEKYHRHVPLLLKVSPDLNSSELKEVTEIALEQKIEAIVAVNTTQSRESVENLQHGKELGGLSGKPLFPKTLQIVQKLDQILNKRVPIIAVGGIMCAEDAMALNEAGASLVQLYTGLIYKGPRLIRQIIDKFDAKEI